MPKPHPLQEAMLPVPKSEDQIARENIPSRADLPTDYEPERNFLMVVPLPTIKQIGSLILPESSQLTLNEGHIVAKGCETKERYEVGDCITWESNSEYRMEVDGVKFTLVADNCVIMRIPKCKLDSTKTQ